MSDLGSYLVVLKKNLSNFFRNRNGELISKRELTFEDPSQIYRFALVFLLNLGMPFHDIVEVTFVGSTLQVFRNTKGVTNIWDPANIFQKHIGFSLAFVEK